MFPVFYSAMIAVLLTCTDSSIDLIFFQEELENLKFKLDKLERERNDFKHSVDKLETKVIISNYCRTPGR